MNKPFQLEFYLQGDVIDLKSYDVLPNIPETGEEIYLQCDNDNLNSEGCYYQVIAKRSLFISSPNLQQKVLIKLQRVTPTDW